MAHVCSLMYPTVSITALPDVVTFNLTVQSNLIMHFVITFWVTLQLVL